MAALHISISAEKLFSVGPLTVTNSILTSLIASGLLILFAIFVRAQLKKTHRPRGLQNLAEVMVEGLYGLVQSVTQDRKKSTELLPIIATLFLFILANNWLGLLPGAGTIGFYEQEQEEHAQVLPSTQLQTKELPFVTQVHASEVKEVLNNEAVTDAEAEVGAEAKVEATAEGAKETHSEPLFVPYFRGGTADLNTTIALALVSVLTIQFFGIRYQHLGYFRKFINLSSPIAFFIGILEIVSEFSRILSFAFRLFGNVFAGEVLLVVITSLTKVIAPMPFYGLEIFVGVIQALVFAMLSVVLMNMATMGHGEKH